MKKKPSLRDIVLLGMILVLVIVILYSGHRILVSTVLYDPLNDDEVYTSKIITRDGVRYFPRQDITTILIMGIDQLGPVESSVGYINTGATDMNILLVFDETNETCTVLHLNRDTMLDMPVLGVGGKKAGTSYGQLALAHTYGSGLDDSCQNVCQTVSDLFYGLQINYYLSMHMDAVGILNDAVGGVSVYVTDDFSQVDASIGMGQVTLMGDQAIHFVQARGNVGDKQNTSRMERQSAYLDGFLSSLRSQLETKPEVFLTAYDQVTPYIVTNCSANAISGMADRYIDYRILDSVTLPGESVRGEEHMEFHLDGEALDLLILELFYAPMD